MSEKAEQKVVTLFRDDDDRISPRVEKFLEEQIRGVRSENIEKKISLQLGRFVSFFRKRYGHECVSGVVKRDVSLWLKELYADPDDDQAERERFAASTVNNHKAHLSLFMGWLSVKAPHLLPEDPTKGIRTFNYPHQSHEH